MQAVKQEILDAVRGRFLQGDSFRMRHRFKRDGTECTALEKDPAMTVTRVSNGWMFHCHRCHLSGNINDKGLAPGQTRARIEALKKIPINKVTEKVDIPYDFMLMEEKTDHSPIPWEAYHWLWKYGLQSKDFIKFGIGWSPSYRRVIIPIKEYALLGSGNVAHKLVGWVGRDVDNVPKKDRKIPKYLTRSKKGKRRYFITPGDVNTVVICEDCVSAIKVNLSTGFTTVALLNTSVGEDLMRMLRGKIIYLWLDGDMLATSVKTVERMRQLGLNAKHIHTPKDPKEYNTLFISDIIRKKGEK